MSTFTINPNNNITVFASLDEARAAQINNAEYFGSAQELAKLVASWPAGRAVEVWNSFAGVAPFDELRPVKKFTNRKAAVARIWKAVQALLASVAQPAAHVAPGKRKGKKGAEQGKRRHTARQGSKKAEVLDLMRRTKGVSLAEIMKKTGWQAHTVRGFVSGTLTRKLRLKVDSFRAENGERTYRITG